VGTQGKIIFWNVAFLHKIEPTYNQILRLFFVMLLFSVTIKGPRDPQMWGPLTILDLGIKYRFPKIKLKALLAPDNFLICGLPELLGLS
jgi:hypothetical protein